jgi:hypothetical protein
LASLLHPELANYGDAEWPNLHLLFLSRYSRSDNGRDSKVSSGVRYHE